MMQAIIECVERNARAAESVRQAPMNRLDRGEADLALGVARLGRDQKKANPGIREQSEPLETPRQQLKVLGPMRRFIGAGHGIEHVAVEYAIAVQEDRSTAAHTTDSHFISCRLSAGCDTTRCQTTAWKASVCGVTVSA